MIRESNGKPGLFTLRAIKLEKRKRAQKKRKGRTKPRSVRTVSGGLPSLGKRR